MTHNKPNAPSVGLYCRCGTSTPDEPLEGDGTTREDWEAADQRCAAKAIADGWRKANKRWYCPRCDEVATAEQRDVVQAFDDETHVLLSQHRKLVAHGACLDDPERVEVEAQINAKFIAEVDVSSGESGQTTIPMRPLNDEERARLLDALQALDDETEVQA